MNLSFLQILGLGAILGVVLEKLLSRYEVDVDKLVGTDHLYHHEIEDKETKMAPRQPKLPICEPQIEHFYCPSCILVTEHFKFPLLNWCCNECGTSQPFRATTTLEELDQARIR